MIYIWNRKEVYNGFSIEEFNRIKEILSVKRIEYNFRTVNRTTYSAFDSTRGRIGSIGENLKYSYEYYIYVHKDNYDDAQFAINTYNKQI